MLSAPSCKVVFHMTLKMKIALGIAVLLVLVAYNSIQDWLAIRSVMAKNALVIEVTEAKDHVQNADISILRYIVGHDVKHKDAFLAGMQAATLSLDKCSTSVQSSQQPQQIDNLH